MVWIPLGFFKMNVSYSKIELYNTCGAKYKFKYLDRLEPNLTFSPLLFGAATDKALNYILEQVRDKKEIDKEKAINILQTEMDKWTAQNDLIYFKNELPDGYDTSLSYIELQKLVWTNLCTVGKLMIDTYISEILPLFESIESVQIERKIKNDDVSGDVLVIVIDFIGVLKDGRRVLFDNKTTSDIKKNYPKKTCVKKSRQLALYTDYYPDHYSGYIVLQKKLVDGKVIWDMIIDKIEEAQTSLVFEDIETKTQMIKDEKFEKNEKSCFSFGRKCEYWGLCKYGNSEGLRKREER